MWHVRIPLTLANSAKQFERCVCWDLSHIQVFRRDRLFRTFILYVKANRVFSSVVPLCMVLYTIYGFSCFVSIYPGPFLNETYKFLFTIKVDGYTCKGIEEAVH